MNSKKKRKKILFVLPSLEGGGAEKVCVQLLNHLDRSKYDLKLALFEKKGPLLKDVPKEIKVYDLKKINRYSFPFIIHNLAKIIKETSPDSVVSFLIVSNLVAILAKAIYRLKVPVIVAEHSVPMLSMRSEKGYFIRKWLYQTLYPMAEGIITVSEGIKNELIKDWKIPSYKIRVVYNAVDLNLINKMSKEKISHLGSDEIPTVIAVGRISKPKGYDNLIKAVKQVLENNFIQLAILGEGDKRHELEKLAKDLNIFESVTFKGFKKNPYKYISKSAVFVLSSLWESFSIVIIEAMACGVPVISTRCSYGPEEIITNGLNGLLVSVEDENELAEAIIKLLESESLRKQLVEAGKIRAKDFSIDKMVAGYELVFKEIMEDGSLQLA